MFISYTFNCSKQTYIIYNHKMYRAIPSASKILTTKWQTQQHDIHMANLKKIKGTVDVKEP